MQSYFGIIRMKHVVLNFQIINGKYPEEYSHCIFVINNQKNDFSIVLIPQS